MIKSFTITNYLGESIKLELTRPDLSGFLVESVDGLGPVKANINTTKTATTDGTVYNSALLNQRDITMKLRFYPIGAETIEDIRHRSYRYFPMKKKLTMLVETDNRLIETTGYVETNEPSIFSQTEGCTILIACPDPYFYSPTTRETIFSGVEPTFEFPLFNDSSSEALLELGGIKNRMEENVFYEGDAEVGCTINIHALGDATNVTIYNINTKEQFSINTARFPTTLKTNIFDDSEIVWNTGAFLWVNPSNSSSPYYGLLTRDDENYIVSDPIPVVPGTTISYALKGQSIGYPIIAWLNEKKNATESDIIDNETGEARGFSKGTCVVPSHASYMIVATYVDIANSVTYEKKVDPYIRNGDTITINTTQGDKGVTLLRQGETYNILNACIDKNTSWFRLSKGDNLFAYRAETGGEYLQFTVFNKVMYSGV